MRRFLRLSLVAALLGAPSAAVAQKRPQTTALQCDPRAIPPLKPEAERHLVESCQFFEAKAYDQAANEAEAAYKLDPEPTLLYLWAQSRRLTGNCPGAVAIYRRYIETRPPPWKERKARVNIASCGGPLPPLLDRSGEVPLVPDEKPSSQALPTLTPPGPPSLTITPKAQTPRPAWYRDAAGNILAGSAVVALGASWGLEYSARYALRAASQAENYQDVASNTHSARVQHLGAQVALAAGSALALTAVIRYVLHAQGWW